jgi:hypothetical protein
MTNNNSTVIESSYIHPFVALAIVFRETRKGTSYPRVLAFLLPAVLRLDKLWAVENERFDS